MHNTDEIALHHFLMFIWFAGLVWSMARRSFPQIVGFWRFHHATTRSTFEKKFSHEADRQGVSRSRFSQGEKLLPLVSEAAA